MNIIQEHRLSELKIRAAILLKDFNAKEPTRYNKAAERLLKLPFLKYSSAERILSDRSFFRLKHTYEVLAIENGYSNWNTYRESIIQEDCLYNKSCAGFLNVWFTEYRKAKAHHIIEGGYLLQYRQDYFVAPKDLISVLGLACFEKEWEDIGYDWINPLSKTAWNILYKHAKANYIAFDKPLKKSADTRPDWLQNKS